MGDRRARLPGDGPAHARAGQGGPRAEPLGSIAVKAIGIAAGWGIATYILNDNRSFAGAVKKLTACRSPSRHAGHGRRAAPDALAHAWGRHVYAVGGNAEAARRAGINVEWVKMSCFIMCGVVACLAGMALGSQLNSVCPQTGGNDTLLRAVGAAAIGGVSLFGGRGKLLYPVVGGLVVATIDNGLGLMGKVAGSTSRSPARSSSCRASCCSSRRRSTRSPASGRRRRWRRPLGRPSEQPRSSSAVEGVRQAAGTRRSPPSRAATPPRHATYADEHGVPRAIEGYDAMLGDADSTPSTSRLPNGMHHDWTMRALEAGKHVLCEKPYTRRADEAVEAFGARGGRRPACCRRRSCGATTRRRSSCARR